MLLATSLVLAASLSASAPATSAPLPQTDSNTALVARGHPAAVAIAGGVGAAMGLGVALGCAVFVCSGLFPPGNPLPAFAVLMLSPGAIAALAVAFVALNLDPEHVVADALAGGAGTLGGAVVGLALGAGGGFLYFLLDPFKTDSSYYGNMQIGVGVGAVVGTIAGGATAAGLTSALLNPE